MHAGGGAVNIIIAKYQYFLFIVEGGYDRNCFGHILHQIRIMEIRQLRAEESPALRKSSIPAVPIFCK